jgi:peptide/nickel transport system substrate-binding protein
MHWWYNETRDPDNALRWCAWGAGENKSYYTRYNNEKVNKLIEDAATESDPAKRAVQYAEIQKITAEEVAQFALYYPAWLNAYSPKVNGLLLNVALQFSALDEATLG